LDWRWAKFVPFPSRPFFRVKSYANVQGVQAIQHHEMQGPIGTIYGEPLERVRNALRFAFDL
jgi:hypothetical protein